MDLSVGEGEADNRRLVEVSRQVGRRPGRFMWKVSGGRDHTVGGEG